MSNVGLRTHKGRSPYRATVSLLRQLLSAEALRDNVERPGFYTASCGSIRPYGAILCEEDTMDDVRRFDMLADDASLGAHALVAEFEIVLDRYSKGQINRNAVDWKRKQLLGYLAVMEQQLSVVKPVPESKPKSSTRWRRFEAFLVVVSFVCWIVLSSLAVVTAIQTTDSIAYVYGGLAVVSAIMAAVMFTTYVDEKEIK